jgi:hypothetical protein
MSSNKVSTSSILRNPQLLVDNPRVAHPSQWQVRRWRSWWSSSAYQHEQSIRSSGCCGRASLGWEWRDELTHLVRRLLVARQLSWQWTSLRNAFSRICLGQFAFCAGDEREQAIALFSIANNPLTLALGCNPPPGAQVVHQHW